MTVQLHLAADEIERLRQRVAELEAALERCMMDGISDNARVQATRALGETRSDPENWRTCLGNEMPPELAPAQIVDVPPKPHDYWTPKWFRRADKVNWRPGLRYRPALDADGNFMVSRDGLEHWARYVATLPNGGVIQCEQIPKLDFDPETPWWDVIPRWTNAPSTHRIPGDWRDSLASVWDGEL